MREEGIYKEKMKIGTEVLFEGYFVPEGKAKESFFDNIDERLDFEIFKILSEKTKERKEYVFINLKPSTLVIYSKEIFGLIRSNMVLEIREDYLEKELLLELVRIRNELPFLLSLDDFGKNSSNFDRLKLLKPDFVKIEISLYRDGSLKDLIRLVKKFSPTSKLIAERVETFFDFKTALREGFDLWQGYFEKELNDAPVINVNNL